MLPETILGGFAPLLFMIAVIYGALEVSGVFRNRKVNAVVAVCIGTMSMTYQPLVEFIYTFMPYAAMVFIVFFLFGFVKKSMFGEKKGDKPRDWTLLIIVGGLLMVVLGWAGGEYDSMLGSIAMIFGTNSENLMWIIGFIVFLGLLWFTYQKGFANQKAGD